MRKLYFLVLSLIFASTTFAQSALNDYKKIDYISVKSDQIEQFIKLSENELQSAYQQLVDDDIISSWALYVAKYPGGETSGYNFISVTTTSDIDSLDNQFSDVSIPKFIPSSNTSLPAKKLKSIGHLIKSEIWRVENVLPEEKDSSRTPSKYLTMDYMNVAPGKSPDYLMLEEEVAKPIHEERINRDIMKGWQVYSLITPSGANYGYNFSTANYFDQISNVEFGFTTEIINQTMGRNANITELFDTIYATRDLVKVELWELYLDVH